jgi:hypothetical protein
MLELADEFNAKLSGRPEDYRTFAHRDTTIANQSTGSKVSTTLWNAETFLYVIVYNRGFGDAEIAS